VDYTVRRAASALGSPDAQWDRPLWQKAETLQITHFPWEDSGHRPKVSARLLYDDAWLAAAFCVEDQYVRAVCEQFQGPVCTDSCVEFFVSPLPGLKDYFNFEVNCGGTMLLFACHPGGETRKVTEADGATIAMAHTLPRIVEPEIVAPTTWVVEYHVPFALFAAYFGAKAPRAGTVWRANFYKCADHTSHPHWGSWAPVGTPRPNFHQPDFFQPVTFG
jgi:hypothetical protein